MKSFKPTFKINRGTGPYASFQPVFVDIKVKKRKCGSISQDEGNFWRIYLAIKKEKTKEEPASFKWIVLAKKTKGYEREAIAELKQFCVDNWEKISATFDLHFFED